MSLSGYMPDLVACEKCGEYETEYMYFNSEEGKLYCKECAPSSFCKCISSSVVTAMRYVALSDFGKIFSFTLNEDGLNSFCNITEEYLLNKTQRKFKTLEFYNVIKD
jgi:DNA repair protein RecO (recombination protein O)